MDASPSESRVSFTVLRVAIMLIVRQEGLQKLGLKDGDYSLAIARKNSAIRDQDVDHCQTNSWHVVSSNFTSARRLDSAGTVDTRQVGTGWLLQPRVGASLGQEGILERHQRGGSVGTKSAYPISSAVAGDGTRLTVGSWLGRKGLKLE